MTLRAFPMLNDLSDSLFADRFNRIDRLFSQLTGSTPLPSTPSYNIRRVGDIVIVKVSEDYLIDE